MSNKPENSGSNAVGQMLQIATGYMPAVCLYAAAKFKIADLLAGGSKSVSDLAKQSGTNADALYRSLRALASLGIFNEVAPQRFENTPVSATLCTGVPGSARDAVLWIANPMHLRIFADFSHCVESGGTAIEHVTGRTAFEYLQDHAEDAHAFNHAMTNFSSLFSSPVLDAYDFAGAGTVADIAGGHGFFLAAILKKHPGLRGVLFEMPYLHEAAKGNIESLGLADRCDIVAGDFFKEVVPADTYVMKSVIHDWDDEKAIAILKNCARAMRGNGRVILVELVIAGGNEPGMSKWIDLEMLAMAGGRERSETEFRNLFARAGLKLARVVPTACPQCVIEAVKQ
jgi:O-methyltransferase domain/Dimerisation domain